MSDRRQLGDDIAEATDAGVDEQLGNGTRRSGRIGFGSHARVA